jgi:hypothetical protein
VPEPVSDCVCETTSTFSARSSGSGMRPHWAVPGSRASPLRVTDETSPAQSTKVLAPGSRQPNETVEVAAHSPPS